MTESQQKVGQEDWYLDAYIHAKLLSCVWLFATPWIVAHQAPRPWNFPSKDTGVGCHFFLRGSSRPRIEYFLSGWFTEPDSWNTEKGHSPFRVINQQTTTKQTKKQQEVEEMIYISQKVVLKNRPLSFRGIKEVGEHSWESLRLQGDPTSPSQRRSVLGVHWKDWCWSWNSNT